MLKILNRKKILHLSNSRGTFCIDWHNGNRDENVCLPKFSISYNMNHCFKLNNTSLIIIRTRILLKKT